MVISISKGTECDPQENGLSNEKVHGMYGHKHKCEPVRICLRTPVIDHPFGELPEPIRLDSDKQNCKCQRSEKRSSKLELALQSNMAHSQMQKIAAQNQKDRAILKSRRQVDRFGGRFGDIQQHQDRENPQTCHRLYDCGKKESSGDGGFKFVPAAVHGWLTPQSKSVVDPRHLPL